MNFFENSQFDEYPVMKAYLLELMEGLSSQGHPGHKLSEIFKSAIEGLKPNHGELPNWNDAVGSIQKLIGLTQSEVINLNPSQGRVEHQLGWENESLSFLEGELKRLNPWRKGPFQVDSIHIDTEWRSDMKWDRIEPWVEPYLQGKNVLDIGCSSGYYMYRMLKHAPKWVLGVDPTWVFFHQFLALQAMKSTPELTYLPVGSEALDNSPRFFDTVFCMGILYHRKSPFEFIRTLQQRLKPGGTLIMETLMVPGDGHWSLTPVDRYARMRNCFTLPTKDAMIFWLEQFGFKDIEWIHEDWTSLDEQRTTEWMPRESLKDCLDPKDPRKTIEGYPAPMRCLVKATAK